MASPQRFSRGTLDRIRRAVRVTENLPISDEPGGGVSERYWPKLRRLPIRNDDTRPLERGEPVLLDRVVPNVEGEATESLGWHWLAKGPPEAEAEYFFPRQWGIVLDQAIEPEAFGSVTLEGPIWAKAEAPDGLQLELGMRMGPKPEATELSPYWPGFVFTGHSYEADEQLWVLVEPEPIITLTGKTTESIAKNDGGRVAVWIDNTRDGEAVLPPADSMVRIYVANRYALVASGKWVRCTREGDLWFLTSAEC